MWYARVDSNHRPFAPEVKQINHLQTMLHENTRLSEVPVGPRMDRVGRFSGFWTLAGPRSHVTPIIWHVDRASDPRPTLSHGTHLPSRERCPAFCGRLLSRQRAV